jgi:hypothetical protein
MHRLFALEWKRDLRILGYSFAGYFVLIEAYLIFLNEKSKNDDFFELWYFVINAIPFLTLFLMPILSFVHDQMRTYDEYYFSLPVKHWKIWASKVFYCIAVFSAFFITSYLAPSIHNDIEFQSPLDDLYYFHYLILGSIFLSAFIALIGPKGKLNPKYTGKLLLFLLGFIAFVIFCIYTISLLCTNFMLERYLLFTSSVFGGFVLTICALFMIIYCKYFITRKLISFFILASLGCFLFQGVFYYLLLHSGNREGRSQAFKMYLFVREDWALNSYKKVFFDEKFYVQEMDGKFYVQEMDRILHDYPAKSLPLRSLWLEGIKHESSYIKEISFDFLSLYGENEAVSQLLFSYILPEKNNSKCHKPSCYYTYRNYLNYSSSQDLLLLSPIQKRKEMIIQLLQSGSTPLRNIGYEMIEALPETYYVPLLIDTLKKVREESELRNICDSISQIQLNEKKEQTRGNEVCESVLDIPLLGEIWQKWYDENKGVTFEDRLNSLLQKNGYPFLLSSMSDKQLIETALAILENRSHAFNFAKAMNYFASYRLNLPFNFFRRFSKDKLLEWAKIREKMGKG